MKQRESGPSRDNIEQSLSDGREVKSSRSEADVLAVGEKERIETRGAEELATLRATLAQQEKTPHAEDPSAESHTRTIREEMVTVRGQQYRIRYVPKEDIAPAFGYAAGTVARVRDDLPPRVKRFVRAHELYHLTDRSNFGGWIGRELRANIIPGLKDPLGFLATVRASLVSERLGFYWERVKRGE